MTDHPVCELRDTGTEALRLLKELLALEAHHRGDAVRAERYRSLALADLLLVESIHLQTTCPGTSRELACLAQLIADQPHPGRAEDRVDGILARSLCLQGNAERLLGDRRGAEERFQAAVSVLTGPPNSLERGFYCHLLAYLREEQGRMEEAAVLLWRAVGIFREARVTEEQKGCLWRLALLSFQENDLERASRLNAHARGLRSYAAALEAMDLIRTPPSTLKKSE